MADAALKDLIPQMEHPFYSLSKKRSGFTKPLNSFMGFDANA